MVWNGEKKKVVHQGVVPQFSFDITFAREEQLQGKKLKKAIDDYHCLTPGTTKRVKSKISSPETEELGLDDVDDGSQRFPLGFKVYKLFEGVPFTGKITGYDSNNRLYHIEYEDGDHEEMYHNEVHAHRDKIKKKKNVSDTSIKITKRKDVCWKHRTRSWKCRNNAERIAATNAVSMAKLTPTFAKVAPCNSDFEEHEHELTIDDVRAITSLRRTKKESEFINMSEDAIPTEIIKLVINSLGSDAITPEEQALGYYTRKKLKKLSTRDQWLASEKKQIDQFTTQGMFGEPMN